jgi:endogenous inhibitor of DNA gyrase (YacG/DUF329 family)
MREEEHTMGRVMIKCPNTGEPVSTGVAMNPTAFETTTLIDNPLPDPCPRCGEMHYWSTEDAWVEDD